MGANRKVSKQNYFSALLEISNVSDFHPVELHKKHKVANCFTTVCVELGYVKRIAPSKGKWIIMRQPLMSDVVLIKKRLRARMLQKTEQRITRQKSTQLTIKPLKRVASLVEPPIPAIDMQQDSQMTLIHLAMIFAAGIIAGGLIATIWK